METIGSLKKSIKNAGDIGAVVKTMKALAAVSIRQYEEAVESLVEYNRMVEMGLQIVLRGRYLREAQQRRGSRGGIGAVVFGSDQGMCGQLNDQIVAHATAEIERLGAPRENRTILAVGMRAAVRMEDAGYRVEESFSTPAAVSGITPAVQDLIVRIEAWHLEEAVDRVMLFYSKPLSGAAYRPVTVRILPLDPDWFGALEARKWPSRMLPTFTMDWERLFAALIREYFFVSLYRAVAESLASEHASRLASMQGAEKNIRQRLDELTYRYNQQRQTQITEELIDIISGFEALTE